MTKINKADEIEVRKWLKATDHAQRKSKPRDPDEAQGLTAIWANRFLNDDEKAAFEEIFAELSGDFDTAKNVDRLQIELVASFMIKLGRARQLNDVMAMEHIDRIVRAHLKCLKATRIDRMGTKPTETVAEVGQGTPANWAADLVARRKGRQEPEMPKTPTIQAKPTKRK